MKCLDRILPYALWGFFALFVLLVLSCLAVTYRL